MPKPTTRFAKILIVLALTLLSACGALPTSPPQPPTAEPDPPSTIAQVTPLPTYPPIPTITSAGYPSSTETPQSAIIPLSTATPDLPQAELNTRIEELEITVTAAARELADLQATNVALAANAASSSGNSGSSSNSEYDIPSYVVEITFIVDATLRDQIGTNNKGAPVMEIREPRVKLPSGTHSWVTDQRILADGGVLYYEIYDPDGEVSRIFFIRFKDIQIREINAQPFSDSIPLDVVLAEFSEKSFIRSIREIRTDGKPIMQINEPRIQFNAGDRIYLRVVPIVADGGTIYYEVFDTDGHTTERYFVRKQDITIPNLIK